MTMQPPAFVCPEPNTLALTLALSPLKYEVQPTQPLTHFTSLKRFRGTTGHNTETTTEHPTAHTDRQENPRT